MPSVVVNAIETDEQKEYRMECVGPTNDEVEEVKTKYPNDEDNGMVVDAGETTLLKAVLANDLLSVKILLRCGEFDVRMEDGGGSTALHFAASNTNNPELIHLLLQAPHGRELLNACKFKNIERGNSVRQSIKEETGARVC